MRPPECVAQLRNVMEYRETNDGNYPSPWGVAVEFPRDALESRGEHGQEERGDDEESNARPPPDRRPRVAEELQNRWCECDYGRSH